MKFWMLGHIAIFCALTAITFAATSLSSSTSNKDCRDCVYDSNNRVCRDSSGFSPFCCGSSESSSSCSICTETSFSAANFAYCDSPSFQCGDTTLSIPGSATDGVMISNEVCVYTIPQSSSSPKDFTIRFTGSNVVAYVGTGTDYQSVALFPDFSLDQNFYGNNQYTSYYVIVESTDSGPSFTITVSSGTISESSSSSSTSAGTIVGIIFGVIAFIVIVAVIYKCYQREL